MLLTFRSFSNTPYIYDPRTNEMYNVDENVFKAIEAAGGKVANVKDSKILAACKEAGITDDLLPMQTPEEFKKEISKMDIGFTKLTLGITHICNLRCKYCIYSGEFEGERTHEGKQMSIATADRIIDAFFVKRAKKDHPKSVVFYGGEPLMNFPVVKHVVERLNKMGLIVLFSTTTNGIMFEKDEILDFVVKNRFIVNISFDGPIQEVVRVDTEGKGTYDRLMAVIEKISRKYPDYYKGNVGFNVTVTPATDLPETVKFFQTHPLFRSHSLNIIRNYDPDNTFCRKYDFVENQKVLEKDFEALRKEYPNAYKQNPCFLNGCYLASMAQLDKRPMGDVGYLSLNSCCYPGLNCAYIDIDGTVYACERTEHAPIGHIDKKIVDDKMVSAMVNKYYEISKKYCPQCWAAKLCPKCFSHVKRGDLNDKNFLEFCEKFKSSVLKSLELFATIKEKDEKAFEGVQRITADIITKRKELEEKK